MPPYCSTERSEPIPHLSRLSRSLRNPQEVRQAIAWSRRDFLRATTGATAGSALFSFAPLRALAGTRSQKAIVVTFGGGARDEETFMPEGQENIPHLLAELIPRAAAHPAFR